MRIFGATADSAPKVGSQPAIEMLEFEQFTDGEESCLADAPGFGWWHHADVVKG
jgi:hypothetical protein